MPKVRGPSWLMGCLLSWLTLVPPVLPNAEFLLPHWIQMSYLLRMLCLGHLKVILIQPLSYLSQGGLKWMEMRMRKRNKEKESPYQHSTLKEKQMASLEM